MKTENHKKFIKEICRRNKLGKEGIDLIKRLDKELWIYFESRQWRGKRVVLYSIALYLSQFKLTLKKKKK